MDRSPNLDLPFILPSQAQKHVTHNEALSLLDAVVQLSVRSRGLSAPPLSPAEGERYIAAVVASGIWAGHDGEIAAYSAGGWTLVAPQPGWLAYVEDEQCLLVHDGADWSPVIDNALNPASLVGVNTVADAGNRLAVKSDAVLMSHDDVTPGSGDMRLALNKSATANTASLTFQTGWSGRAEFGLAGDDDWHVKVSPDGTAWKEALVADLHDGRIAVQGLRLLPAGAAPASSILFTPGGDGTVSIYRTDTPSGQNPRTAMIDSVAGDIITLSAPVADTIFGLIMGGVSQARIWNTSRSPDSHSAWVRARPSVSQLQVSDAAHMAGWLPGDTIQLGDPLTVTPNRCITLDISPMLVNLFGAAFPQTGLIVKANMTGGADGDSLSLTPSGIGGSFVWAANRPSSAGVAIMACTDPSPISNSNLVRLREDFSGEVGIRLISSVAVMG